MKPAHCSTRMENFTPIFDAVVQDVGLVGASVYGRIWRYCQGGRHCCDAALETIAKALNISTRTVLRWAKELCEKGYLKDLTPDLRNKPHTYIATNKVHLVVEIRAEVDGVTQSQPGMTESHPDSDRESLEETSNIPEERDQESAAPSPCDPLPPTSFEGWLQEGQAVTNKQAVLKWMHDTLFPDRDSPSYSYVGRMIKQVGGAGRLAQLLWEAAAKRPTGDVLAYIQATVKSNHRQNGGSSGPRTEQPVSDPELEAAMDRMFDENGRRRPEYR